MSTPVNLWMLITGTSVLPILLQPSIDAGVPIAGINDGFVGSAPDLGAYEYGGTDWTAGSDITPDFSELLPPPLAPSGLSAIALSATKIELTWTDNANNENGFEIERKMLGDAEFSTLKTISSNRTAFIDSSAAAGTTYRYRIRARGDGGISDYSNTASARTPRKDTVDAGLVALWNFQDDSVQTVVDAAEVVSIQDNGFLGSTDTVDVNDPDRKNDDVFDRMLFFNKAYWVTIPHSTDLTPSEMTISGWFKLSVTVPQHTEDEILLIDKMNAGLDKGYRLYFDKATNTLKFQIADGAQSTVSWDASSLTSSKWYHLAASADGSNLKLYLNGEAADG